MKIPHNEMIMAAREAFEIQCKTGASEILVPCDHGVPITRQMFDGVHLPKRDTNGFWVFKVENGEFYCVDIPAKYKENAQ